MCIRDRFNILLQQPDSAVKNAERFGSIANEMASLKEQREKIAARLRKDQTVQLHVHTMEEALDEMSHRMQQWDEEMIRQLDVYKRQPLPRREASSNKCLLPHPRLCA